MRMVQAERVQQDEIIITNPDAARALRDTRLLAYFLEPQSPSVVARRIGQPANLVHHHVKRCLELGLLMEQRRQGRRVYYQLVAKTFKCRRSLLGVEEDEGAFVRDLTSAFMDAFVRSDRLHGNQDLEYAARGFERVPDALSDSDARVALSERSEARPAHLVSRTLKLQPETYLKLVRDITRLVLEAESKSTLDGACTLSFLAFDGVVHGLKDDTQVVSRFAL
jgi:DNA-binding transcriptional ArsR family regulator